MSNTHRINISLPNLVNICVDENEYGEMSGRLYHGYRTEPILFANVVELLTKTEQFYDTIGYPQASTKTRSFVEKQDGKMPNPFNTPKPERVVNAEEVISHRGARGTFITCVKYRQNSTWQGEIFWSEKEKVLQFSNMLDFIKLVDTALRN